MASSALLSLHNETRQVSHFILNRLLHLGGLMAHNYVDSFWLESPRCSTNINNQGETANFMEHLCSLGFHFFPKSGCKVKHVGRLIGLAGLQKRAALLGYGETMVCEHAF